MSGADPRHDGGALAAWQALARVLEDEFAALRSSDPDVLAEVVQRKQTLVRRLACNLNTRDGNPAGADGRPDAAPRDDGVRQIAVMCYDYNRRNHALLRLRVNHVRALLAIVSGRPAPETYDARGHRDAAGPGLLLDSA